MFYCYLVFSCPVEFSPLCVIRFAQLFMLFCCSFCYNVNRFFSYSSTPLSVIHQCSQCSSHCSGILFIMPSITPTTLGLQVINLANCSSCVRVHDQLENRVLLRTKPAEQRLSLCRYRGFVGKHELQCLVQYSYEQTQNFI